MFPVYVHTIVSRISALNKLRLLAAARLLFIYIKYISKQSGEVSEEILVLHCCSFLLLLHNWFILPLLTGKRNVLFRFKMWQVFTFREELHIQTQLVENFFRKGDTS